MNEIELIPKIRFRKFKENWEKRKFKENIISIETGTNLLGSKSNKGIPLIKMGNIQRGYFSLGKLERLKEHAEISEQYFAKHGDFLFNTRNTLDLVGKGATWVKESNEYVFNSNVARFTFENINTYFFNYLYNTRQVIKQVRARAVGTTSVAAVYPRDLNSLVYHIPTDKEQIKIGLFFKQLDETIFLQQQLLNDHKQLKKAMLQKMFPQKGETVPKFRFTEFTDKWKHIKLGEVSERVKGNDGRMNLPTLTISAGRGWLDQRERFSANIAGNEQKNYTLLSRGELSYNHGNSKLAKYGVIFELKSYTEALVPRVYHSFRTTKNSNSSFIEYMFETRQPDRELAKLVSSGARMDGLLNISYDAFMGIKVKIPTFVEQKKIGNFFKQLDETISFHEKKLETYQELKKAMLQKMFV